MTERARRAEKEEDQMKQMGQHEVEMAGALAIAGEARQVAPVSASAAGQGPGTNRQRAYPTGPIDELAGTGITVNGSNGRSRSSGS
ncbi:hypothetical protein E4U17_006833 [Claviceps sp. LM77 group G4]|nr:hypothetical protein E4U17_006833 [Claviceps sp. LM77 group G4]KAG6060558.1 hypothetical protein E4U33_006905 [Claviceps sp. LM78 group G4]KAG6070521.1 hypothetical protein E4U16_006807 [Claviceps sp. LM84 group G4]